MPIVDPFTYFESHLRVAFTGPFPLDMLRQDRCAPAREADSHMIIQSLDPSQPPVERTVYLTMLTVDEEPRPSMAAWKSFGIHVDVDIIEESEVPE